MNYYNLIKLNSLIKNPRLKFLGLFILHKFNKRYLSVHFDPINACNLRCKMCYFTDKEYLKELKGIFKCEELTLFSKAILRRAVKLQVGCGTEPTLYKDLDVIFKLASEFKVPHISMATNANLIQKDLLEQWVLSGLNEITVSLHGVYEDTYQEMMGKGNYKRFLESLAYITEIKKKYPRFKLRVNYTFNEDNFNELKYFWKTFNDIKIDILQLRPIIKIGNTEYNNFSLDNIISRYNEIYYNLLEDVKKRNVLLIAPTKEQLIKKQTLNSVILYYTYCYISPNFFWRDDFDWRNETFNEYSKRTGWSKELLKKIFASEKKFKPTKNHTLNYNIS